MKNLTRVFAITLALTAAALAAESPPSPQDNAHRYSLQQAMSDKAQLHTIAFDGLAFLTGDFAFDTFLPPGKVSDYFGFQYMRDIDAVGGGHNTSFLTKIASNVLRILDADQKNKLMLSSRRTSSTTSIDSPGCASLSSRLSGEISMAIFPPVAPVWTAPP